MARPSSGSTLCSLWLPILVALLLLATARPAHAVNCTITGYAKVEPVDTYYCDTRYFACTGWNETDLWAKRGAAAAPLEYLRVEVWQGGVRKAQDLADGTGFYSMTGTFPGGSCAGQAIELDYVWQRANEGFAFSDPDSAEYRFRFVQWADPIENALLQWYTPFSATLTGSSTNISRTFLAVADPPLFNRIAQIYFTANSAIKQYKSWSTNLSDRFSSSSYAAGGIRRIAIDPLFATGGGSAGGAPSEWVFQIAYDVFYTHGLGHTVRHELGHLVDAAVHYQLAAPDTCYSGNENFNFVPGRAPDSCEYGPTGIAEALPSFFGLSSLVSRSNNDAWDCYCKDDVNQDICNHAATWWPYWDDDGDAEDTCMDNKGAFQYIGDAVVDSTSDCTRLKSAKGCNCSQSGGICVDAYRTVHGWRNITQVERFFWDMIDTNNEGGQDDTARTMSQLISTLEGMPCTATNWEENGGCNEFDREFASQCNPLTNGQIPGVFGSGTRDAYNIWDFAAAIPGDQVAERALNCVQGAVD